MPLPIPTSRPLAPAAALAIAALLAPAAALAQATAPAPPAPASESTRPAADAAPQTVEITGTTAADGSDERRRSTASRLVFGRDEIERMGDTTLGEVLKRLPGVTLGGPPGRGGQIRLRGMGGGYTQILIDGQRVAPGFSLDSISPDQIERIEILRAPVAEYGARAIAGTINVITRADFKRKANELRIGGGADGEQPQANANWQLNGQTESLGYNLSTTLFRSGQDNRIDTRTLGLDAAGQPDFDQLEQIDSESRRRGLFANARLQFRLGPGHTLDLQPYLNAVRSQSDAHSTLEPSLGAAPYLRSVSHTETSWQMGRLNGTWLRGVGDGGRLQLRFGGTLSSTSSLTQRDETGGSAGALRTRSDASRQRDLSLNLDGKFSQLLAERHSASAGWELQHGRRDDSRVSLLDGQPTLTEFGETIQATVQRAALYAQDEWEWSKSLSFYAGARWEAILTTSDSAVDRVSNRSAVFTPLAHLVWKLPGAPRDQLRLSLTRSYRSPTTSQLVGRPVVARNYPDLGQPNEPTDPDRAGNPDLKPELAWGLELGVEHYLEAGGLLSANAYARRIDDLIRTVRSLQSVSWASVPRWVAQPQNLGAADAAGLELEAKARVVELWPEAAPALQAISLRGNLSLMWSRVSEVMGPDNRLEGQPPWTANLGADWPLKGLPLTLGASLNHTPAFAVQQIDSQSSRQGTKTVFDAYVLWRLDPAASARLSIGNAGARNFDTGTTTVLADGSSQASDSATRTYTTVNLRAEFRF
ncbi:MAG: TonB-dependent receptor [Burkholderiaceae bacterium]|nr:TonB-dependent receptor [Burkholderiaceae bacterium]